MKKNQVFIGVILSLSLVLSGCNSNKSGNSLAEGASGDMEAYESGDVNAIEQARPQIMVVPSDLTMKNFGAVKEKIIEGRKFVVRDYQKYLLADDRFPRLASFIQDAFNKQNYPLADFGQTLKQLDTNEALDAADDVDKDAKTLLLTTARPDIILEMNYLKSSSLTSHDYKNKNVSYTLSAIDAYTTNVVATVSANNIKGTSTTETIQQDLEDKLPKFMTEIQKYYSDILKRGREVTVRVNVDKESNQNLSDESIDGDVYSDWIVDYVKTHTVKGAYKLGINTSKEISFTGVRIKLLNEDGTQYSVYDWARDFQKSIRANLGLKVSNKSQGLGEIVLTVKGI